MNIKAKQTSLIVERREIFTRVTELIIGILTAVYSVWLFIQDLSGGFLGMIADKSMLAGASGTPLCGLFMTSGTIYISTESSDGLGSDVTGFVMIIVAGILGFLGGIYAGLTWIGVLTLTIGIGFLVWRLKIR